MALDKQDLEILAKRGGPSARRAARRALGDMGAKTGAKCEMVEDCAVKALAAVVGYPLEARRKGLERALRMMKGR